MRLRPTNPQSPHALFALMYPDTSDGSYTIDDADAAGRYPSSSSPEQSSLISGYSGIPDSAWRHTHSDMPVGYLSGDPESPSQLCLIPDVPLAPSVRIVYLVASCDKFYRQTVPPVIDQLG